MIVSSITAIQERQIIQAEIKSQQRSVNDNKVKTLPITSPPVTLADIAIKYVEKKNADAWKTLDYLSFYSVKDEINVGPYNPERDYVKELEKC